MAQKNQYYEAVKNDIDACDKQIRSILANNNFDLSSDNSADFYVSLATTYEEGSKVAGELFDMKECFASLNLKVYDNKTRVEILNYNIPQIRVLVPVSNSSQQAKAVCARELMKRANVQLPQELKKMNVNR